MHSHDDKYPCRSGFEPGNPRLQSPVDTNEPSGPAHNNMKEMKNKHYSYLQEPLLTCLLNITNTTHSVLLFLKFIFLKAKGGHDTDGLYNYI